MKILITGITGYLGEALCAKLIQEGNEIVGVARNEGKLITLQDKFPTIKIVIGDIADKWVVKEAMAGVDGVIHAAAQKHVGLSEEFVAQTINSNIIGSNNILEESFITLPKFVVGISTDKASNPKGVYGLTKRLMERLFEQAQRLNPETKYRTVRYGNVMGSTGSFITKWKPAMMAGQEVIITDPEATRFFWTVNEAVDAVFSALEGQDARPFIPQMKAVKMGIVLEACMDVYGKSPVKVIGLQEGENLHETIDGITYSDKVEQYTKEEFKAKFL